MRSFGSNKLVLGRSLGATPALLAVIRLRQPQRFAGNTTQGTQGNNSHLFDAEPLRKNNGGGGVN